VTSGSGDAPVLTGPITFATDTAAEVSAMIGPDGGSLEVTNAAGDRFVLDVPSGALLSDETITMAPATDFENTGFPAAGVVFGPSGTYFFQPATLTITPAVPVPVDEQFMFTFSDDGAQFGAAESQVDTADVVIVVGHFSGYALGAALRPSQAAFLERQASDADTRITSRVNEELARQRDAQIKGTALETTIDWEALFTEWEEQVVKPRLAAGGSSCAAAKAAIATVLAYDRQRQLLGFESGGLMAEVISLVEQAFPLCEEEAITKCKAAKDPSILMTFWLSVNRTMQLLGADDIAPMDPDLARSRCATAYSALGSDQGGTQSGTIADLSQPFTLEYTGLMSGATTFTPTDDRSGTFVFALSGGGFGGGGDGTYTIAPNGADGTLVLTAVTGACSADTDCSPTTMTMILTPIDD
jgi:hypothetical protein